MLSPGSIPGGSVAVMTSIVLSDSDINRALEHGSLDIERVAGDDPLHVGPSSVDVHLAPEKVQVGVHTDVVNIADEETYPPTHRVSDMDPVTLASGEFCLARTDEYFDLPDSIMGLLHGRSSIGRLGLFIENAGLIDRGFEGTLTLELFNATENPIEIPAQTRIGQVLFLKHERWSPAGAYDGKYQGQEETNTSKTFKDTDLEA